MKSSLQKLGRVYEYETCYQVLDAVHVDQKILRDSLSGFEIIVYKEHIYNFVYILSFIFVIAAVIVFLFLTV